MDIDIAGNTVGLEIEDGDIITDVVLIVRLQDLGHPGEDAVLVGVSSHTGLLVQRGMIETARDASKGYMVSDD